MTQFHNHDDDDDDDSWPSVSQRRLWSQNANFKHTNAMKSEKKEAWKKKVKVRKKGKRK